MKTASRLIALLVVCMSVSVTSPLVAEKSYAQPPGNITVFGDQNGSQCNVTDRQEGSLTLYVFHTSFSGMLSSDFRVVESSGFQAVYVGESIAVPVHGGDFRAGIFLGYGECRSGSLLLGAITYQTYGTSTNCAYVDVAAGQIYPWPATQSCFFEDYPAPSQGQLYVNADSGCNSWCTVATEETTWGRVKAIYREQ